VAGMKLSDLADKIRNGKKHLDEIVFDYYCKHPIAFKAAVMAISFTPLIVSLLHGIHPVAAADGDTHDWTGHVVNPNDGCHAGADGIGGTSDDYWEVNIKTNNDVTHNVRFYAYDSSVQTIHNYEQQYNYNDLVHITTEDVDGVHCGRSIEMMQDGGDGCYIPVTWAGILSSLGLVKYTSKYASKLKKKAGK
jgi:hypothetical protein